MKYLEIWRIGGEFGRGGRRLAEGQKLLALSNDEKRKKRESDIGTERREKRRANEMAK